MKHMDGFINLNKAVGLSSQGAVTAVKRILHGKVGHCGTLDPAANGVLPICLGQATRLAEYVVDHAKVYSTRLVLGIETDSYDASGVVMSCRDASGISEENLRQLLPHFCGEIDQRPPIISALKQNGEPIYKKARRGEKVELAPRRVSISEIRLLSFITGNPAYVELLVACGRGTYIRSLARDIALAANSRAHLSALVRTGIGGFSLTEAFSPEEFSQRRGGAESTDIINAIRPISPLIFKTLELPFVYADRDQINPLIYGQPLEGEKLRSLINNLPEAPAAGIFNADDKLIAVLEKKDRWQYGHVFPV